MKKCENGENNVRVVKRSSRLLEKKMVLRASLSSPKIMITPKKTKTPKKKTQRRTKKNSAKKINKKKLKKKSQRISKPRKYVSLKGGGEDEYSYTYETDEEEERKEILENEKEERKEILENEKEERKEIFEKGSNKLTNLIKEITCLSRNEPKLNSLLLKDIVPIIAALNSKYRDTDISNDTLKKYIHENYYEKKGQALSTISGILYDKKNCLVIDQAIDKLKNEIKNSRNSLKEDLKKVLFQFENLIEDCNMTNIRNQLMSSSHDCKQ